MITFRHLIPVLLITLFSNQLGFSQSLGQSVYSSYGIGEFNEPGFLRNTGMGNIGIANREKAYINPMNPASYSSGEYTRFEAGAQSIFRMVQYKGNEQRINNTSFSHLAISLPLSKKWGTVIGLQPFSSTNYTFSESKVLDEENIKSTYTGSGGLNKIFIGNAYQPFSFLSIGINTSYLFGSIRCEKLTEFTSNQNSKNSKVEDLLTGGGLFFEYGLQLTNHVSPDLSVCFGVTGSLAKSIQAKQSQFAEVFSSIDGIPDTIAVSPEKTGKIELPNMIGMGISAQYKEQLTAGVDIQWSEWGKSSAMGKNLSLGNGLKIGMGIEYQNTQKTSSSFLSKFKYRGGYSYTKTPIVVNGHTLTESGLHLGIGIPFPKQRYPRELLLGVVIGRRSTGDVNLPSENLYKITVGLNLSDKWFERRKFD